MKLDLSSFALPLERFNYNKADGSLSAFDSDLQDRPFNGVCPYLKHLYDDACDVGILIRSKEGKEVRFYLESEDVKDGDLQARYFKPEDACKTGIKSVVIFND